MRIRNNPFSQQSLDLIGGKTPRFDQEQSEDFLSKIGDGLIGGLATIGGILDKPGRTVRGALDLITGGGDGGSLREILSVIPFSDSLGITDYKDRVSGKDLLENLGLVTPEGPSTDGFTENDFAGIGAEILTDPLAYLGIGTLTKAGKAVNKAGGKTSVGFQKRAAGAEYSADNLSDVMKGREDILKTRDFASPEDVIIPKGVSGVEPQFRLSGSEISSTNPIGGTTPLPAGKVPSSYEELQNLINSGYDVPSGLRFDRLGFKNQLPYTETVETVANATTGKNDLISTLFKTTKQATGNATPLGSTVTIGKLPLGIDRLLGIEPFRIESKFMNKNFDNIVGGIQASAAGNTLSRLFDSRIGNASTREVQEVQRDVGALSREKYMNEYLGDLQTVREKAMGGFAPIIQPRNEAEASRFLAQAVELGDTYPAGPFQSGGSGIIYGNPRTVAEYEKQLLSRPAIDPKFANRLDEMKATGEFDDIAANFNSLQDIAQDFGKMASKIRDGAFESGLKPNDLLDDISYLPREKNLTRRPGESYMSYAYRSIDESLKTTETLGRKEMLKFIPGGRAQIEDWVSNMNLRAMDNATRRDFFIEELTGGIIPTLNQAEIYDKASQLAKWVDNLGEYGKVSNGKIDTLFDVDLFSTMAKRMESSSLSRSAGDVILETIRRFGTDKFQLASKGLEGISASEILAATKMNKPYAANLLQRDFRNMNLAMKNVLLPKDVAQDLMKIEKAWTQPAEMRPILMAWDNLLQMFKGAVTYPFASFHTRNMISAFYNMWRDGITPAEMIANGKSAFGMMTRPGLVDGIPREKWINDLVRTRTAFNREVNPIADVGGGNIARLPGALKGDTPWENLKAGFQQANVAKEGEYKYLGWVVRQGKAMGNFIEDWVRSTHYMSKIKQGYSPEVAAQAVKKYQLDYSKLTQFERNYMKRMIPWWSFSRNNLPPILEEFVRNPAKLSESIRLGTSRPEGGFVPQYISEGVAIPLGQGEKGFDRYIGSLGLPFEDEMVRAIGNVAGGRWSRATQQLLGTGTPWLKFPLENAFGIQLHSGRKLEDLIPNQVAQAAGDIAEGAGLGQFDGGFFNQLMGLTPAARFGTTVGQISDERKPIGLKLANLLSGTWVTDIDATKLRNIAVRDMLQELMRGNPAVTNWEKFYVKPENFGGLTPDQQNVYTLYKTLEDRAREEAKQRAAGLRK